MNSLALSLSLSLSAAKVPLLRSLVFPGAAIGDWPLKLPKQLSAWGLEEVGVGEVTVHGQAGDGELTRASRPIRDKAVAAQSIRPQNCAKLNKEALPKLCRCGDKTFKEVTRRASHQS